IPWNPFRLEQLRLEAFVVAPETAADRRRRKRDDDDGDAGVRVDVDQAIEPDVEAAFLARFAKRGGLYRFTAIDEAAWKDPLAVAPFDGALPEHDASVFVLRDR